MGREVKVVQAGSVGSSSRSPHPPRVAGDELCHWHAEFGICLSHWFGAQHPEIFCSFCVLIVFILWLRRLKLVMNLSGMQELERFQW